MARFKVGDTVTIRQWGDMEKEYWLDTTSWSINVPQSFTTNMRRYCWKKYIIRAVMNNWYTLQWEDYSFSDGMFEESKEVTPSFTSPVSIDTPPKYWAVERDKSNPLYQKCVNYIADKSDVDVSWHIWKYLWFDWDDEAYNWYNWWDNIETFENNPTLITLEEWDKWFGGEIDTSVEPSAYVFKKWDRVKIDMEGNEFDWLMGIYDSDDWDMTMNHRVHIDWRGQWRKHFNYNHLILVDEAKQSEYRFKVWDKVYMSQTSRYWACEYWTIEKIDEWTLPYLVILDSWYRFWAVSWDISHRVTSTWKEPTKWFEETWMEKAMKYHQPMYIPELVSSGDMYTSITADTWRSPSKAYIDKIDVENGIWLLKTYTQYKEERSATKEQSSIFTFKKLR